jgi:histidine ammonia-lyase
MVESRAIVEDAIQQNRAVYGVTTGFGELKDQRIPIDQVRQLQLNLLRSHAAGVGPEAPLEVSRAMILLRAASLVHGRSGVRPDLVESLLMMLERGVTPVVPLQGSVGASGDLAPLAHLALTLIGEGEAWLSGGEEGDARRMPASLALRGAGLQPLTLEAKEGLALINGTQFSTAIAVLACADARAVWEAGNRRRRAVHRSADGLVRAGARRRAIAAPLSRRARGRATAQGLCGRQRAGPLAP